MGWRTLRDMMPMVVLHMAAAAVHLMATIGLGGGFGPAYEGFLAFFILVLPMAALLAILTDHRRLGAALFLLSFMGTAGLLLFGHLRLGFLAAAQQAPASAWKKLFFFSAMLLPLLQIAGIAATLRTWGLFRASTTRLASK